LVFVTSAQTAGDLGGVAGADMTCTMFAVAAVRQRRVQHGASPLLLRELIPAASACGLG
jgi:hypothetical protein